MELWVIAEILGLNVDTEMGAPTPEQFAASSEELLTRRVRAAQVGEKVSAPRSGGMAITPQMAAAALARKKRVE